MTIDKLISEIDELTYSDDLQSAWASERIAEVLASCKQQLTKLKHIVRFGELYPHLYETLLEITNRETQGIIRLKGIERTEDIMLTMDLIAYHQEDQNVKLSFQVTKHKNIIRVSQLDLLSIAQNSQTINNTVAKFSEALMVLAVITSPNDDFRHYLNFLDTP